MMTDLIEAYHAIYDVKDQNLDNDSVRVAAYNVLAALDQLMVITGTPRVRRYDGEGRPGGLVLKGEDVVVLTATELDKIKQLTYGEGYNNGYEQAEADEELY